MEHFKTQGLVIDKIDIGERDRLYSLLTSDFGKIKLMARGIRRPEAKFSGHLDLLNLVSIIFINGKNNIITDAVLENQYLDLKKDVGKFNLALNIVSIANSLLPEQENTTDILPFVLNVLNFLSEKDFKSNVEFRFVFAMFIFKFLGKLGYLDIGEIKELKNDKINAAMVDNLLRQANDFLKENFNLEFNFSDLKV